MGGEFSDSKIEKKKIGVIWGSSCTWVNDVQIFLLTLSNDDKIGQQTLEK